MFLFLRAAGAKLVGTWLRVKPALRTEAAELLQRWRSSLPLGGRLLGVHARGTDKAARARRGMRVLVFELALETTRTQLCSAAFRRIQLHS